LEDNNLILKAGVKTYPEKPNLNKKPNPDIPKNSLPVLSNNIADENFLSHFL
jgi:hypothetical protein